MANVQSVIEIIFNGIDNASDTAEKIGGKISGALGDVSEAGNSLEELAAPLAAIADKILEIEAAVTVFGGTLVGIGVKAAGEFNDSLAFTSTLFDATGAELAQFRTNILDYASGSTQSIEQINAALQNAIGQGIEYADALGLMEEAEKLAVAQGAQLSDSTSLLASTMNAYGLKVSDAAKLSDVFSITVRDGKISAEELAAQLSNVTPLANAAGIGIDQIGAAVAVLTAQGNLAGPAITGVKQIIEGIIKPTGQAAEYAQSLGLSFDAATLKSRGLDGVLQDVQKATNGSVDAFAKLFTTSEGLTAALALAGPGADKFAKELKAMREETGVTDAAFQKMADNIGLGSQKIKNAINVAFINLGAPLLDELGTIQKGIATVFSEIGDEFKDGGALRPITAAFEAWGVDIGATIESIAKNLPKAFENVEVSGLIEAYKRLGKEVAGLFKSFFGDIDLTTVDGLSKAIQKVIDTIESLTLTSAGIVGTFKPMAAAAGETVDSFVKLDAASQIEFGEFIGAMRAIILAGPEVASALILIGKSGVEMGTVMDAVFGGVQVVINALQVTFDGVVLGILGIKKALLEAALAVTEFGGQFALTDTAQKENAAAIKNFQDRLVELQPVMDGVAANLQRNKDELENGWKRATGEAADGTGQLSDRLDLAQRSIDDFGKKTKEAGDATRESVKSYDGILATLNKIDPAAQIAAGVISDLGEAQKKLIVSGDSAFLDEPIKNLKKTWDKDGNPVYTAIDNAVIKATGAFKLAGESASEQAKKVSEATKAADDFQIKMEEIASNERIKTIEAFVSLNIAGLEADMERVKATFASLDTTISSTGDLLGSLFGNLADTENRWKEIAIEEQIDLENKRRQDALDLQKRLTEAEIARIEAQTRQLERGDPWIKIDGTGLEPQLEAFMWEILKAIRTQVNAEFAEFLLGTGAPA
jgi:TP901 family phage tail tape measure protein